MEYIRAAYAEMENLDQRQLISIESMKRWLGSLVVVFGVFQYIWTSMFSGVHDTHIPQVLLQKELQFQEGHFIFHSEAEVRSHRVREINFVLFACVPEIKDFTSSNEKVSSIAFDAVRTMKSATLFSSQIIHFHIFTEDRLYQTFISELDKWPNIIRHRVTFQFHAATRPEYILQGAHKTKDFSTRKSCDLSFLFIPNIIKDLDYVIYARSGVVFLNPIEPLWYKLKDYNDENVLSLPLIGHDLTCSISYQNSQPNVEEVYDSTVIQYDIHRLRTGVFTIPFERKLEYMDKPWFPINVNEYSTVNMTWNPHMILTIYKLFANFMITPGRDLLNIIAAFNPYKISALPCHWNYDISACVHEQVVCPYSKLVVPSSEYGSKTIYPEFEQLCSLIDHANFDDGNMTHFNGFIQYLKDNIYKEWPKFNSCSLKNIGVFCCTLGNCNDIVTL